MTSLRSARTARTVRIAIAVLTFWALATIVPDLTRPFAPLATIGLTVDFDGRVTAVDEHGPAAAAGLVPRSGAAPGDRIDFRHTSPDVLFTLYGGLGGRPLVRPGRPLTISFISPGGEARTVTLTAVPRAHSLAESISLLLGGALGVGFIALGCFLAWQFPLRGDVVGFFLYSIWFNPGQDYVFYQLLPAGLRIPQQGLAALLQATGLAGFVLFALRFPTDHSEGRRYQAERALPALVIVLTALTLAGSGAAFGYPSRTLWLAGFCLQVALYPLVVIAFLTKLRSLARAEHERLRWVIYGCIPGLFFFLLAESFDVTSLWQPLLDRFAWRPPDLLLDAGYLVNALVPISIGYAVLRRRVLPVDFIVNRGLTLGIVWVIVAMCAEAAVLATHRFVEENHVASTLVIAVVVTLVAPLLEQLKERVNEFVDRFFFIRLHAAQQALAESGARIAGATSIRSVEATLVEVPCDQLALQFAALFVLEDDGAYHLGANKDWPPAALRTIIAADALVRGLRPAVSARETPVAASDTGTLALAGLTLALAPTLEIESFVIYGLHESGARLTPDEIRILTLFVRECASARAHLRAIALHNELVRLRALIPLPNDAST